MPKGENLYPEPPRILRGPTIVGIAGAIGTLIRDNTKLITDLELGPNITDQSIKEKSGIEQRGHALPEQSTLDLVVPAAIAALAMARIKPDDLDLICAPTVTAPYLLPGLSFLLHPALGLTQHKGNVMRGPTTFDLNSGCNGFIEGLNIAEAFIRSGKKKTVGLFPGDKLSSIVKPHADDGTNYILADGGSCAIVQDLEYNPELGHYPAQIFMVRTVADGYKSDLLKRKKGGSKYPYMEGDVVDEDYYIRMVGKDVFKTAVATSQDLCHQIIQESDIDPQKMVLVGHQANKRILEATADGLQRINGYKFKKIIITIGDYGNTSAASIPTAIYRAYLDRKLDFGDHLLMPAAGSGMAGGVALVQWTLPKPSREEVEIIRKKLHQLGVIAMGIIHQAHLLGRDGNTKGLKKYFRRIPYPHFRRQIDKGDDSED